MAANTKSIVAIALGVVILVADVYWTYTSYYDTLWLALGLLILVADAAWMYIDYDLMRGRR